MGLEVLIMIDIDKYIKLKTEVSDIEEKIRQKVKLIHNIIGRDIKSRGCDVLENIETVYEQEDKDLCETYIVIESTEHEYEDIYRNKTYVKKYLFDTPDIGLRNQQEYFVEDLEKSNQLQLELKKQKEDAIKQTKEQELKALLDRAEKLKKELGK